MPVYSHSRLGSFEKCPLQYRFRYIDRIKRDTQGVEAFMGNRVHEAMEHLYREKRGGRTPKVADLVGLYHRNWEAQYSDKVRIVRKEYCAADYRATGERCVRDYYDRYHPFDDGETLGLEEKFQIALDPAGRYLLMGFIDRILRAGEGVYEVHDYKTSASLPSDEDLRRDRQLTLYQMAVSDRYPDAKEVRLVWHFLAHGKRLESRRTEADVAAHRKSAIRLIDVIEAARDYPARESALCRWCEYRDICPAQKHLVASETAAVERSRTEAAAKRSANPAGPGTRAEQMMLIPVPPGPAARPHPRAE